MEAYRIERFGSVDGIVLRSSEDPWPGVLGARVIATTSTAEKAERLRALGASEAHRARRGLPKRVGRR